MNKKIIVIVFSLIFVINIIISVTADINLNIKNDNSPPNPPVIKVPDKIPVGKWFKIEATIFDPDGDNVYVRFNASIFPILPNYWWGPFPSGFIYTAMVKYKGPIGTYKIGVQAKDIYNATSDWTFVQFNITKVRTINNPILNVLKSYPNFFLNP